MISVEEAQEAVLSKIEPLGRTRVSVENALGRVLAEDVISPRPIPPWANSAMDGYAVRAADVAGASGESPVTLCVIEELQAGFEAKKTVGAGEAIRIMTGAPMPKGADAVVLVEKTESMGKDAVRIFLAVPPGEAVRPQGEDVKEGEVVFSAGMPLNAAAVGMLANIGRANIYVHQRPRVAILATGEEVVDLGQPLGVGQIYNSNTYSLAAQVTEAGGEPLLLGIARDNPRDLARHMRDGLAADVLLTSGGVSVGDFDLVKGTLGDMGSDMHFWRVRMKPGKPMAFGSIQGQPVFGLPGNPVSTMVSFELFVRPALLKMQGKKEIFRPKVEAAIQHPLRKSPERRHYVRSVVSFRESGWEVRAVEAQGSNILHSMVRANALIVFPEFETELNPGDQVQVVILDEVSALGAGIPPEVGPGVLVASKNMEEGK
ncbi:MAG: molybdopterin molybdotransferase MoeA [bacterium]|nr:molybdopterin molybdotransferase MoeA [bacterium]